MRGFAIIFGLQFMIWNMERSSTSTGGIREIFILDHWNNSMPIACAANFRVQRRRRNTSTRQIPHKIIAVDKCIKLASHAAANLPTLRL